MRDIVLAWMQIPGPKRSWTAQEVAELIEQKWPAGKLVTKKDISRVREALEGLVKEGLVKLESEPRFFCGDADDVGAS